MRVAGQIWHPKNVRSNGDGRFKHKGHKPSNNLGKWRPRALNVVRLFNVLKEREWTFEFKVEAKSPRGFKYLAEGSTPEEAFLRAFGQWRNDFTELIPKIPKLLADVTRTARVLPTLDQPKREQIRRNIQVSGAPWGTRQSGSKEYNRLYMRQYRGSRPRRLPDLTSTKPDRSGIMRASWEKPVIKKMVAA